MPECTAALKGCGFHCSINFFKSLCEAPIFNVHLNPPGALSEAKEIPVLKSICEIKFLSTS
jgi:hypothetical protein